eukprot:10342453-Lingulodinium_polyedra.AAC.1
MVVPSGELGQAVSQFVPGGEVVSFDMPEVNPSTCVNDEPQRGSEVSERRCPGGCSCAPGGANGVAAIRLDVDEARWKFRPDPKQSPTDRRELGVLGFGSGALVAGVVDCVLRAVGK